jgi:hypothetical protein
MEGLKLIHVTMNINLQQEFKNIFWDAFHRPDLKTEKFNTIYLGLEAINNILAGPFFSIYEKGECNYVFSDKIRFPSIKDEDDFLTWCSALIEEYRKGILEGNVENDEDSKDKQILLYQTDIKMELADLAYQIQKSSR